MLFIIIIILCIIFTLITLLISKSPQGYEDADGFHYINKKSND